MFQNHKCLLTSFTFVYMFYKFSTQFYVFLCKFQSIQQLVISSFTLSFSHLPGHQHLINLFTSLLWIFSCNPFQVKFLQLQLSTHKFPFYYSLWKPYKGRLMDWFVGSQKRCPSGMGMRWARWSVDGWCDNRHWYRGWSYYR